MPRKRERMRSSTLHVPFFFTAHVVLSGRIRAWRRERETDRQRASSCSKRETINPFIKATANQILCWQYVTTATSLPRLSGSKSCSKLAVFNSCNSEISGKFHFNRVSHFRVMVDVFLIVQLWIWLWKCHIQHES